MIKNLYAKHDCRDMDNDEIIQTILSDRGIDEDLNRFLRPTEDDMLPLDALKNIDKAFDIINKGIEDGKHFVVHYDQDADGHTSGAIMTRYLQAAGADVSILYREGKAHGLDGMELNLTKNDILIVVDSLNNNYEVYDRALEQCQDVVILDHHVPSKELLKYKGKFVLVSSAVNYGNPDLSGAGVCLKMCLYLDYMNLTDYADDLWWLAAIGIVGDMCSMASPENRYIVSRGLAQYDNPIVKKMIGNYMFDTQAISFSVAPLINGAIRTYNNDLSIQMFTTDDTEAINGLYSKLKECKEQQNQIVNALMEDINEQINAQLNNKFMVFLIDDVGADIAGLLGNKILSIVQRPLVVVHDRGDKFGGSMRAVGVENFMEMVNKTGLATCNGHELAAGFECYKENWIDFLDAINKALEDVEFSVDVYADIELTTAQFNESLIKTLTALNRISGTGFKPITVLVRTNDYEVSTFSTKKHLKIVDYTGAILVKWNDQSFKTMKNDKEFVGVGTLSNVYYGRTKYMQLALDEYTQN